MDSKKASGLAIIGGLLMAVGSFLTWAVVTGEVRDALVDAGVRTSQTGVGARDGFVTLVIGLALIVAGYLGLARVSLSVWFGWLAAALGVGAAVYYFFSLKDAADGINDLIALTGLDGRAGLGIGYYLVAIGALLGIVGVALRRPPEPA
jgi:hypothetical protein